uniref:PARP catalytic domain-containing protein n=1 Tax=Solanum lycopersicum TaxID=4081 RepID=A0A3Q7J5L9_SOLLC
MSNSLQLVRMLLFQTGLPSCCISYDIVARNIIEKIFLASTTNPSKQLPTIKKVLRVNNTIDMLEKFEKYRETVKKRSFGQYKNHPKITVDGNELLQFHITTMSCCYEHMVINPDELCKDPSCCVCRLIQFSFRTSYNSKNGILLSTNSDVLCEHANRVSKGMNVKRAVIVCRTIAGRVVSKDDVKLDEEYDSISIASGLHSRSQNLVIKDSSAVLPRFIIVLD